MGNMEARNKEYVEEKINNALAWKRRINIIFIIVLVFLLGIGLNINMLIFWIGLLIAIVCYIIFKQLIIVAIKTPSPLETAETRNKIISIISSCSIIQYVTNNSFSADYKRNAGAYNLISSVKLKFKYAKTASCVKVKNDNFFLLMYFCKIKVVYFCLKNFYL